MEEFEGLFVRGVKKVKPGLLTGVRLGLFIGFAVVGIYMLGAIILAIVGVISAFVRTCGSPASCDAVIIIFGLVTEIGVAILWSLIVVAFPTILLATATGLLIGSIEKFATGRLSRRAALLNSFGVALSIGGLFEFMIGLKVATKDLGEHFFGLPWETFAHFWQGLPIVVYVAISICMGWIIHNDFQRNA